MQQNLIKKNKQVSMNQNLLNRLIQLAYELDIDKLKTVTVYLSKLNS